MMNGDIAADETTTLHSIDYVPNNKQITIALSAHDEKLLINTDLTSIEHYVEYFFDYEKGYTPKQFLEKSSNNSKMN